MSDQRRWTSPDPGISTAFPTSGFPIARCRWLRRRCPSSRTHGCRIVLADGRELIDGIASWWSVCHGYNHPHIRESVARQLETMPHVMFGGLVHEPALILARGLRRWPRPGLTRVFFSDSGSIAVEVALKIALQYWRNQGQTRKKHFLCFSDGYHGDTFGAMAVSDPVRSMHKAFRDVLCPSIVRRLPGGCDVAASGSRACSPTQPAAWPAMIVEPLVQGAGGMRFHDRRRCLPALHALAKKHDILFIADEIATGFWRTRAAGSRATRPDRPRHPLPRQGPDRRHDRLGATLVTGGGL